MAAPPAQRGPRRRRRLARALLAVVGLSALAAWACLLAGSAPAAAPAAGSPASGFVTRGTGAALRGTPSAQRGAARRTAARAQAQRLREAYDYDEDEDEEEEQEPTPRYPVVYSWPLAFERLRRQAFNPGHVVLRKWLQKGKDQGYVSMPFTSAIRTVLRESDENVCLVGRREISEPVSKEWQKILDDIDTFDISGEVSAPADLDPLEPPWDTPLDEPLPTDQELRAALRNITREGPNATLSVGTYAARQFEELAHRARADREGEDAKILRRIVEGLPEELREEDNRSLIRSTVLEVLKLLWAAHLGSEAVRLRWRLACTDGGADGPEDPSPVRLRAYFILAGEPLEFMPGKYVDPKKVAATSTLSSEQLRRMSADDWASSVAATGTNLTEALKRVPQGWTTFLKGEAWPNMTGKAAVYRLPQTGRRLFIQVDYLRGAPAPAPAPAAAAAGEAPAGKAATAAAAPEEQQPPEEPPSRFFSWLGPLAGFATAVAAVLRQSPPYLAGQQRRREVDSILRGIQRVSKSRYEVENEVGKLEQRLWMEFGDADEAPVVMVVGGETETGRVICRKLVTSGYHVVLLKTDSVGHQARVQKLMPQGAVLASASVAPMTAVVGTAPGEYYLPQDLYDAVAGIDKLVICACDDDGAGQPTVTGRAVKNVLASWLLYRNDFAERQRAYMTKVRLFNFMRETDFQLWDLERERPSDMRYGRQRAAWTKSSWGEPLFIGQFYEPVGQVQLKSPRLKLNFKRFSGLLVNVYNQAVNNRYSWFLRTSDFEDTRLQYECDFTCPASRWVTARLPFNAFRAVRVDGVPLPPAEADKFPLRREDVVQMGVAVRTGQNPQKYKGDALNYFSLALNYIKAFRTQSEPQVVCLSRVEASADAPADESQAEPDDMVFTMDDVSYEALRKAEEEVAAEIEALVRDSQIRAERDAQEQDELSLGRPRTPMQAVLESGVAATLIKVTGLNDHPGGKYPVAIQQASIREPLLSASASGVGKISRGDAAALVVSALTEPACVNAEILAGEPPRAADRAGSDHRAGTDRLSSSFEIGSTLEEDVKAYLRRLTPNI